MNTFRLSRLVTWSLVVTLALALLPVLPRAYAQANGMIAYGEAVQGQITAKNYFQLWQFEGQKGDRIQILMEGDGNLDPYLGLIEFATENVLVEDDDSGGNGNAYIETTLPSSGTFLIVATRYNFDIGTTEGQYALGLAGSSSGPTNVANPAATNDPVEIEPGIFYMGDMALGEPVNGAISAASYAQLYSLELPAGTEIMVAMLADESKLDSYLFFADEELNLLAEDDDSAVQFGGDANDAFLNLTVPQTGVYYVVATRAGADMGSSTGTYVLVAGIPEDEPQPAAAQEEADDDLPAGVDFIDTLSAGDTVQGTISDDSFMHLYTLEGQAGQEVTITMEGSGGLDAYLGLLDPAGDVIAEDDDSLGGVNAVITITLPESGTYLVAATRSNIDEGITSGPYTLTVRSGALEAEPAATGLSSFGGLPGRAIAADGGTFYLRGNGASDNPEKSPPVEAFFGLDAGDLPGRAGGSGLGRLQSPGAQGIIAILIG